MGPRGERSREEAVLSRSLVSGFGSVRGIGTYGPAHGGDRSGERVVGVDGYGLGVGVPFGDRPRHGPGVHQYVGGLHPVPPPHGPLRCLTLMSSRIVTALVNVSAVTALVNVSAVT